MLLSVGSFYYGVFDLSGTCVQKEKLDDYYPSLNQLLPSSTATIGKVEVAILNSLYCLSAKVHETDQEDIKSYLNHSIDKVDRRQYSFLQDEITHKGMVVNYLIPSQTIQKLESTIDNVKWNHLITIIINTADSDEPAEITLIVLKETMFVVVQHAGQIRRANHYKVDDDNDRLYYLTLAYQSIQPQHKDVQIRLIFGSEHGDTFIGLVRQYFQKVAIEKVRDAGLNKFPRVLQLLMT